MASILGYQSQTGRLALYSLTTARRPVLQAEQAWNFGQTRLAGVALTDAPGLLAYRPDDGLAAVFELDVDMTDGALVNQLWRETWATDWTALMPVRIDSEAYLLLYNAESGLPIVRRLTNRHSLPIWRDQWSTGWTLIKPYRYAGLDYLFAHKVESGAVAIDQIKTDDAWCQEQWVDQWTPGWSALAAFRLKSRTCLLSYSADDGTVNLIDPADKGAKIVWQTNLSPGWSHVLRVNIRAQPHLFCYQSERGRAALYKISDSALIQRWLGAWTPGITSLLPL